MTKFEFFMTFYGLLLGLAVAELLLGFANLLRSRVRPRLGLFTPLLGVAVLLGLMATFIDAWTRLQNVTMTMESLALPTAIGVLFFFASAIVVPRDAAEWTSLDDYYLANRRWTIGLLIVANLLILGYEAPFVRALIAQRDWFRFGYYLAVNFLVFGLLTGALLLRPRLAIAACLAGTILLYLYVFSGFSMLVFDAAPAG